jgi:hypothetical protein
MPSLDVHDIEDLVAGHDDDTQRLPKPVVVRNKKNRDECEPDVSQEFGSFVPGEFESCVMLSDSPHLIVHVHRQAQSLSEDMGLLSQQLRFRVHGRSSGREWICNRKG